MLVGIKKLLKINEVSEDFLYDVSKFEGEVMLDISMM